MKRHFLCTSAAIAASIGALCAPLSTLMTADAVAAHFGLAASAPLFNDAGSIEEIQEELIALRDQMDVIQATAKLEGRDLTPDENQKLETIFADFEALWAKLEMAKKRTSASAAAPSREHETRAQAAQRSGGRPSERISNQAPRESFEAMPGARSARSDSMSARRHGVLLASTKSAAAAIFGNAADNNGWQNSEEYLRAVANRSSDPRLIANATGVSSSGVDGGYSIPGSFYFGVIEQAMQAAELAPRCRIFPAESNTLLLPMPDKQNRSAGIAGLQAFWSGENQTQTAQKLKWRAVEMKLHKTFILAEASSELTEDGVQYDNQLTQAMAESSAYTWDAGVLYGTGVGQPLGMLNAPSAIEIAPESGQVADTVVFDNIVNLYGRMAPACQKRAVWYVSPNLVPQLLYLKFPGSDNPIMLSGSFNDAISGAPSMTIFGRPVVVTEIAPALGDRGDISFADMSQYGLLLKNTARLETDAGPGFARDVMSWRMIQRITGTPLWDEPITPYNGGPTLTWATYLGERA